jgi:hypothetical protein
MRRHTLGSDQWRLLDETWPAKGTKVTPPESLNTSHAGDKFLWFGGSAAPFVQRVGAWILGIVLVAVGVLFLDSGRREAGFFVKFIGLGMIFLAREPSATAF